jgi:hypothetical protein
MADHDLQTGIPARPPVAAAAPRRRSLALFFAAFLLLAGGGGFAAWWYFSNKQQKPSDTALEGELIVSLQPNERIKGMFALDEAGAAPVRGGGSMSIEARINPSAYMYLVWLNCDGKAVPLYPWNHDSLDVTDINQPPPVRRSATVVNNPPIGGGWKFGKKGGLETVLLLARRTPLDEGTRLGSLIGPLPVPPVRHREEAAILGLDAGSDSVATILARHRGSAEEAQAVDEPLRSVMLKLRDHFEFIRAVRFAHVEE